MGTRQVPLQALAHVILHILVYAPSLCRKSPTWRSKTPAKHQRQPQKQTAGAERQSDWYLHVMSFPVLQLFVGLGFPYEGPAPLEAIANGCAFLNPKFNPPKSSKNTDFFIGKPTLREVSISFMLLGLCVHMVLLCVHACTHEGMHTCTDMHVEARG